MYEWNEFFEIAKEFYDARNNNPSILARKETMLRNSISRAYYAAYHKALRYLSTHGLNPLSPNESHTYVKDHLDDPVNPNENKISKKLNEIRVRRKKADYDNVYNGNIEKEAEATLKTTSEIINEISQRKPGSYTPIN